MGVSGAIIFRPLFCKVLKSRPQRAAGIFFARIRNQGNKLGLEAEQVDSVFRRVLKATT